MRTEAQNVRNRAQRQPRADGERTRAAILRTAASLATVDGLEGLSIGNLAAATGIDLIPRALWFSWRHPSQIPANIAHRWRTHWTRERFTLVAPDNYRADFLEIKLCDASGGELAVESLYVDDGEDEEAEAEAEAE